MPAQRKPTNVLALNGTFKHDPARGRAREGEPELEPVDPVSLPVPYGLTHIEAVAWADLAPRIPAGTFAASDLPALIMMTRLYARVLYDEQVDLKLASAFLRYLALFGMTPADRSRVKVAAGAKRADPDDEFFGGGAAA